MELRKFVAPEIITGYEASLLVGRYLNHFASKRPMIVTDANVIKYEWFQQIINSVNESVEDYVLYTEVTVNPKDYEAMKGAEVFLSKGCDLIIAIGGGSPMDCAKCISIVSTNGGHILDYEGVDVINLPGPPLICIPTTAGTSADVSQFAIINDDVEQLKKAIISKKVVPDLALIDPVPLMTMDFYLTACTGMDALTHAIEAYVSNAQSSITDVHALEAIKLIHHHIFDACSQNRTIETMYQMMMASLSAGLAFSNASLGAVHALAHSLGGRLNLPHGECNSILLDRVIELNYESAKERYDTIAQILGIDTSSPDGSKDGLIQYIQHMRHQINIQNQIVLSEFAGKKESREKLLHELVIGAMNDPCMVTNPKELSYDEVRNIYEQIF
jgi:alcohol dehydrogenase class IV